MTKQISGIARSVTILVQCFLLMQISACTNLIYGERTGFNLGVSVNSDPAKPVKMNAGLERSVGTLAPPKSDGGEAVSMVSSFNIAQTETGFFAKNTLAIQTDFASGAAAIALNQSAAQDVFNDRVNNFAETDLTRRINTWISADRDARLDSIRTWLEGWNKRNKAKLDEISIRFGQGYEDERLVLVSDLNVP